MATKITEAILTVAPKAEMTLDEAKYSFMRWCKVKNLRPSTLENYNKRIDRFLDYYRDYFPKYKVCGNIERTDLEAYTLHLRTNVGMTENSVNSYLRSVRTFLYYLMDEEQAMMPFKVRLIRAERKLSETYTDAELRILTTRPNMRKASFAEYRNWVIVNFLLATGVRASTLINVRIMDLDFHNDYITLDYTKSGKSYRIPMDINLRSILLEYLEVTNGEDIEPVFITEQREPLTYDGLKTAIERYNKSRRVDKKGLHLFRHTFAKKAVMNGMDVFTLQKVLGHADLETSRNYVEMFSEDVKERFNEFSPLSNLLQEKPQMKRKKSRTINMSRLRD